MSIPSLAGYGDYRLENNFTVDGFKRTERIKLIAIEILLIGLTAVSTGAAIAASILLTPFTLFALPLAFIPLAVYTVKFVIDWIALSNMGPPITTIYPELKRDDLLPLDSVDHTAKVHICADSAEGNQLKRELLKEARHNFVISGSYCGGSSLDSFLDIAKEKFRENPHFKGYLITQTLLLDAVNLKKLREVKEAFPTQFFYTLTPASSPIMSLHDRKVVIGENHVKFFSIDDGSLTMFGGSGLTPPFETSNEGSENGREPERKNFLFKDLFFRYLVPDRFRDQDFLVKSSQGKRWHLEILKLFASLHHTINGKRLDFSDLFQEENEESYEIEELLEHRDVSIKAHFTGVEEKERLFEKELINLVDNENDSILVAHMYFQPTERLFEAFKRAAERGVKIKILTNKYSQSSPIMHLGYAHGSIETIKKLERFGDVESYFWNVTNSTYHKKVILFGDHTAVTGSGNLSKKSLYNIDYENNFTIRSPSFVAAERALIERECQFYSTPEARRSTLIATALTPFSGLL